MNEWVRAYVAALPAYLMLALQLEEIADVCEKNIREVNSVDFTGMAENYAEITAIFQEAREMAGIDGSVIDVAEPFDFGGFTYDGSYVITTKNIGETKKDIRTLKNTAKSIVEYEQATLLDVVCQAGKIKEVVAEAAA